VTAKTGGGNITIQIGRNTTGSNTVNASSGGGNVAVSVPGGLSARIHVASGMGKIVVDPRFSKIDDKTYQSPDYNSATNKIEITATSGAGNVSINSN
jgi:predicted membrane protein